MNEDHQGPGRRGGGGTFGGGWGLPVRNLRSPSKPSIAGMGPRAQATGRRGGREGGTDQAAAQNTVKTEPIDTTLHA